jgi:hypothetical protein
MSENRTSKAFRPLRSLTRLLLGGLSLGSKVLRERLQSWDGSESTTDESDIRAEVPDSPVEFDPLPEELPPPGLETPSQIPSENLRYALIGLIFEGEEQLERGLHLSRRVGGVIGRVLNPVIQPIAKIPNPATRGFDRLIRRGQSKVDHWVERGREEEALSRQLAQEATTATVDESITYMAQNPALEALVQEQSVSLARQILQLVRADAVSTDYFFEGVIRYALRRKPRYLLSPPNPQVQKQANWTLQDIHHEDLNGNE